MSQNGPHLVRLFTRVEIAGHPLPEYEVGRTYAGPEDAPPWFIPELLRQVADEMEAQARADQAART